MRDGDDGLRSRLFYCLLNSLRDKIAAGAVELDAGRVVDGDRFFAECDQELDGHEASRAL